MEQVKRELENQVEEANVKLTQEKLKTQDLEREMKRNLSINTHLESRYTLLSFLGRRLSVLEADLEKKMSFDSLDGVRKVHQAELQQVKQDSQMKVPLKSQKLTNLGKEVRKTTSRKHK